MLLNTSNADIRRLVSLVCSHYEIDNDLLPAPDFINELLATYEGGQNVSELEQWLEREIPLKFPAVTERPRWLQAAEWPFANGHPMIFLGQIDIGADDTPDFRTYFHDYTSLYVFMPQGQGRFEVIMQQL